MKTILVADDHELVRLTLKKALELSNYRVITAIDGKEAFDILLNHKVDFCVIDLNMPNINGYELIMLMKGNENLKDIPFIVVSALDNKELFNKIADVGACWVQQKGKDIKEVASIVKSFDILGC